MSALMEKGNMAGNCVDLIEEFLAEKKKGSDEKVDPELELAAEDLLNFIDEKLPQFLAATEPTQEVVDILEEFHYLRGILRNLSHKLNMIHLRHKFRLHNKKLVLISKLHHCIHFHFCISRQ